MPIVGRPVAVLALAVSLPELVALCRVPSGRFAQRRPRFGMASCGSPRREQTLCGFGLVQPELSVLVMLFPFNDSWKRGTARSPPDPVP